MIRVEVDGQAHRWWTFEEAFSFAKQRIIEGKRVGIQFEGVAVSPAKEDPPRVIHNGVPSIAFGTAPMLAPQPIGEDDTFHVVIPGLARRGGASVVVEGLECRGCGTRTTSVRPCSSCGDDWPWCPKCNLGPGLICLDCMGQLEET